MLKIGDFSKIAKTTIKTLRYYDDIGLFKPYFVDDNGYRYYKLSQLKDLLKIMKLRSLDLPVESILEIFNNGNELEILNNHLIYLENEKIKRTSQITSLNNFIKGDDVDMKFEYKIKNIESNIVYYKHGVIDSMSNLFNFVLMAGSECGKLNPTLKCKDYCYVTYTANEYKESDIELEYVEAVEEKGIESDSIKFRVDPKIKALCVNVKGSYSNLTSGYDFALNQVKSNGYKINGSIREVYIHGCWDKELEEDYLTEIQVPIE